MSLTDDYNKAKKQSTSSSGKSSKTSSKSTDSLSSGYYSAKANNSSKKTDDIAPVYPSGFKPFRYKMTVAPPKEKKKKWYEQGLFEDGWDFGDVTKSILGISDKKGLKTFSAPDTTDSLEVLKQKVDYFKGRKWLTAEQQKEALEVTKQYNQMALHQYADTLSKTKMDGANHTVLEEIEILANMKSGKEKDERKEKVLAKMEELGMDSSFYSHFAGDGEFDWDTFGSWLGNSAMAGLNSFNKGLLDTADVLLGAPLREMGWENNPISEGAEYYNDLYSTYRYNADLMAEKLGGNAWNFGSDAVEGTVGALPNALLMFMTGGQSATATTTSLTNQAAMQTGNILTKAGLTTEAMLKNPQYWMTFARELGSDYKEAKELGASDVAASVGSVLKAFVNSGLEIGTDGGSGIQGLGDALEEGGKPFWEWVESSVEEGGEEILQKLVGEVINKFGYGSDEEILNPIEYAKEGTIGMLSGMALGGGQAVVQSGANAYAEHQANKLTDLESAVKDQIVQNRIAKQEKNGKTLTAKEKANIEKEVERNLRKGYLSAEEIEEAFGGETYESFNREKNAFFGSETYKNYTKDSKRIEKLKKQLEELGELPNTVANSRHYESVQTRLNILEARNKKAKADLDAEAQRIMGIRGQMRTQVMDAVKDSRLAESYRELERSKQKFQTDVSKYTNENAKKTVQSILDSGLGDNSNQFHETVEWLAKLSEERNVTFDLTKTERLKGTKYYREGYVTNGFKTKLDGKTNITVNLDGNYLNTTVGHEITHVLEEAGAYEDLANAVKAYAIAKEGQEGYNKRLNDIKEIYGDDKATIDSEITADIIGEYLFTDYDFVNSLSTENRNVFQKIYDEIKYLFKIATADSREARELEKVKKMFDKAWRENGSVTVSKEYEKASPEEKEFSDAETQFSIRKKEPPKKTIEGFKVFVVKDGKLFPPMVANPEGEGTPMGVWLDADVGGLAYDKNGKVQLNNRGRFKVKAGGKGTQGGGGELAFRPGWHLGEYPDASQFGRENKEHLVPNKKGELVPSKELFPYNFVWARCEVAADNDYQLDAMSFGVNEKGNFERTQAGLPYIPEDGYYKYRTNANPDTAPWIISGSIKVVEILNDDQVAAECAKHGVTPQQRQAFTQGAKSGYVGEARPGGKIDLSMFGLSEGMVTPTSEDVLDQIRASEGLAETRKTETAKLLKTLPGYAKRQINFDDANIIKEFAMNNQSVDDYRLMAEESGHGYLNDDKIYSEQDRFTMDVLDTKSIQYSYSAIPSHKKSLEKNFDFDNASLDLETINQRYDEIIGIWEKLGGELDSKFLNDWNNKVERPFTIFKAQSGYKYNVELSSMCKKGVPLFEAIDTIVKKEVMKELDMKVMGKEEKEILYDILKQKHFEIPCAICYVEQARQREGVVIDAFLNGKSATGKKGADVKLGWNQVLDSIQKEMKANGVDYNFNFVSRDIATDKYIPAESNMDEQTYTAFAEAIKKIANEEITRYNKANSKNRPLLKDVTPEAVKECFKGGLPSNLKIFKVLLTEPSSRFKIQNDLLYSSMTTKNLTMAHNGLYSLFNSQGGVSGYKTKQAPTVYWGEILNKKWKPADTRKEGGIRNQSNSDFQMYTLLDQAQMYMDFSAKGYYLQAYTKVLSELKLFGLSRGKINASLIPQVKVYRNSDGTVDVEKTMENAGLDENGNPIYDDIEGINHTEAFMLLEDPEYSKNIGGICIGYSDNHIRKLLDDNRVQLIIGFHDKTNDPNKRYRGARYAKNYNGLNEATKLKADGTSETVHIGFNPFVKKAEQKFKYNEDTETFEGTINYKGKTYTADDIPRLATDLYLENCAKKNLTPAYNEFHDHPNYYKLLADFSLYDSEGHYAPHQKVAYNMPDSVPYLDADGNKQYMGTEDYIKIELQKELAVRDSLIDALSDDSEDGIIPRFKAEVNKRNIAPTQYSVTKDSSGRELSAEQQEFFKDSKAVDENGNLKVMYHGTSRGGFNIFDTYGGNHGLFGVGSYFTDSNTIAESYTNKGKGKNKKVYETYLNITNPIDMDATANPAEWVSAFEDVDFPESGTNEDFYRAVEQFYADQWMSKWEVADLIKESIQYGMGYDGITHIGGGRVNPDGERHRVYIAFEPEQIKNVDNIEPTDAADIRYSMTKQQSYHDYMDAVNTGDTDTAQSLLDDFAKDAGYNYRGVHRSFSEFTVFDREKIGSNAGTRLGDGFYVTLEFKDEATARYADESYGKNRMDLYVKMESPLVLGTPFDENFVNKMEEDFSEWGWFGEDSISIYAVTPEKIKKIFQSNDGYEQMETIRLIANRNGMEISELLKQYGFDSVIDENDYVKQAVVFDETQLKSAEPITYDEYGDVIMPYERFSQDNMDIRYSMSKAEKDKMDNDYFAAIESGDEEVQKHLVREYAKASMPNSKLLDENGNLREVYHGTNTGDFTVFNPDYIGMSSGDDGFFGMGFYFAYSKGEAAYYGAKRIIPAYLNLTNPFDFRKELHTYNGKRARYGHAPDAVALMNFADKFPDIAMHITMGAIKNGESSGKQISVFEFAKAFKDVIENKEFDYQEMLNEWGEKETLVTADPQVHEYEYNGETRSYRDFGFQKRFSYGADILDIAYEYLSNAVYSYIDIPRFTSVILDNNREFTAELKNRGYDGTIQSEHGDEAVAFYPNQIKSAQPVTYDDEGNVIPLSKRFDSNQDDLRYSMSKGGKNTSGDWHIDGNEFGYTEDFADFAPVREDATTSKTETVDDNVKATGEAPIKDTPVMDAPIREDAPKTSKEKPKSEESIRAAQRKQKSTEHTAKWESLIGNTTTWKDMSTGLQYKTRTLRRILRKVVRDASGNPDIKRADAIYDELETKYDHNEALLKRESAKLKEVFQKLNLNHKEDQYAQMLGELRYNPETTLTEDVVKEYLKKHKNRIDEDKVNKAITESRKLYDDLLIRVNEVLREQGFKEIPYRKGYFPHFSNPKQNWVQKALNWKVIDNEIPTSIAGLTEMFKPNRSWQSFNKQRTGDKTDYSLYQGLDTYIHGALDWIYHIDDLQSRRALENLIRYTHSEKGIQEKIDAIKESNLDAEEAQKQIDAVLAEASNPLSGLVRELMNRTNTLANKKSSMDRGVEDLMNRKIYSTMTNLNSRITANQVVGSLSSAMTNFIPMVQSWHQVSPAYTLVGLGDFVRSTIKDDGMIAKSDFLTNRLMEEEKLYQTGWDKVSDKAAFMMNIADKITSQTVWRSKYYQNLHEGMSEAQAIRDADQFAKNLMAGRSRGNAPTIFDAKNPFIKVFTAFQLEVANQYGYMFEDVPQDSKNVARLVKGYATAFFGAYMYNALYSSLVGRDAALDPVKIIEELMSGLLDDEEENEDVLMDFGEDILEQTPYIGGLLGGGRIPISSAFPYSGYDTPFQSMLEDFKEGKDDGNWSPLIKEMLKPLYYIAMPIAGGQIKKTNEGLAMFSDDHPMPGSYTTSGNLRFPVEDTLGSRVQAALFGQYSSENARKYFDSEQSVLYPDQIEIFKNLDMPIEEYWEYRNKYNAFKKTKEQLQSTANSNLATDADILKSKYASAIYSDLYDLYDEQKKLASGKSLSKQSQMQAIQNRMTQMLDNVQSEMDNIYINGYYATIGDKRFDYSDYNHKWYEISGEYLEKEQKAIKRYDITPDVYWNNQDLFYNADYYFKYNPEREVVSKAVFDGKWFANYAAEVSQVKGEDKNNDGRTDTNSKKRNIFAYIDTLDVSDIEKKILRKMSYTSEKTYNREIAEYIINLDISKEEKKSVLESLNYKVDAEGYISW